MRMCKRKIIIAFISLLPFISLSQTNKTDSILLLQKKSLDGICKEVKAVGKSIDELDSTKFSKYRAPISFSPSVYDSLNNIISTKSSEPTKEESWSETFRGMLGDIVGALIGVWLALYLYNRQRKAEILAEEEKFKRRLNEKRKYLITTIESALSTTIKYKTAIEEFNNNIKKDPLYIMPLAQYPLQVFERFQKIVNDEEYFHAFLDKYGDSDETIESFRQIAGSSDFLHSQISQLQIRDYEEKDHAKKLMYKELFDDCTEILNNMAVELNESGNVETFQEFNSLLSNYYSGLKEDSRMDYHQHNLVQPAFIMMQTKNQLNPQIRYLINKLLRCSQVFNHIKLQNLKVGQDLADHFQYLDKIKEVLENELEYIKSKK